MSLITGRSRKLYEMCLFDRLCSEVPFLKPPCSLDIERSTLDQFNSLDLLIKASCRSGKKVHLASLDIKAAYDSVSVLFRRCEELRMYLLAVATLRSLLNYNSANCRFLKSAVSLLVYHNAFLYADDIATTGLHKVI